MCSDRSKSRVLIVQDSIKQIKSETVTKMGIWCHLVVKRINVVNSIE